MEAARGRRAAMISLVYPVLDPIFTWVVLCSVLHPSRRAFLKGVTPHTQYQPKF